MTIEEKINKLPPGKREVYKKRLAAIRGPKKPEINLSEDSKTYITDEINRQLDQAFPHLVKELRRIFNNQRNNPDEPTDTG